MRSETVAIVTDGLDEPDGGWRDDLPLDSLGLDSVALLDRLFRVEERFGISLPLALPDTLGALLVAVEQAPRQ